MSMPETNRRPINEPIRVYAPSRGNLAEQPEYSPVTRVAEPVRRPSRRPQPDQRPLVSPKTAKKRRSLAEVWRAYKVTPKAAAVLCILLAAAAMLFVLRRYDRITAVQHEIIDLGNRIEQLQNEVERTGNEYNSSIDINAAHEAARAAGMVYPGIGD